MIPLERQPRTAPVLMHRCPIHGELVAADGDGRLLGQCTGCATWAANRQREIEHGDLPIQLLLKGSF